MHLHRYLPAVAIAIVLNLCTTSRGEVPVVNASFELDEATGWTLNRGKGDWISPGSEGDRAIAVSGDGTHDNAWISDRLPLASNTLYRLQFQARRISGTTGFRSRAPCSAIVILVGSAGSGFSLSRSLSRRCARALISCGCGLASG